MNSGTAGSRLTVKLLHSGSASSCAGRYPIRSAADRCSTSSSLPSKVRVTRVEL